MSFKASWRQLLDPDVQAYIDEHSQDDVRTLALKKSPNACWDLSLILEQIKVRQKAMQKSPQWYETKGIIFPSGNNYEQCSSEACARYKASLAAGKRFVDLTAGTGMDSFYFSQNFEEGLCVERDPVNAEILAHNFETLKEAGKAGGTLRVVCDTAEHVVKAMEKQSFVYIDPQRRDSKNSRFFRPLDCSPDIEGLIVSHGLNTQKTMVKTSPLLDIRQTIETLRCVNAVHVVEWQGECKEVLYILSSKKLGHRTQGQGEMMHDPCVTAVKIDGLGRVLKKLSFRYSEEQKVKNTYTMPQQYIYEPGAAFQKAGGYKIVAARYGVSKLHRHTHLYTSQNINESFPGKLFELVGVVPVHSKAVNLKKADMALRNFPGTVAALRKKLKLAEGGDHKIFACTLADNQKRLMICKKM